MIIKQENHNDVDDLYYFECKVQDAFNIVRESATGMIVDTDELHEAVSVTQDILKDFDKKLYKLEERLKKQTAKTKIMEKLQRGHEND